MRVDRHSMVKWPARLGRLLLVVLVALFMLAPSSTGWATPPPRLRVVLLLDASSSMAMNDPQKLVRVASKMLVDLTDERDHITVISFGSQTKVLKAAPGSDHAGLREAIGTLGRIENCTDYGRALESATGHFQGKPEPGERRVVLFLTDGKFEPGGAGAACGRFETGTQADRQPHLNRVGRAADKLSQSGTRVFAIGLGAAPARAQHSSALLRSVASKTNGKFLQARTARDVPRIFASIFGALVGAPVIQATLARDKPEAPFVVPKGAERLHVVVVPDSTRDLAKLTLERKDAAAVPFEPAQTETGRSGYRLARVSEKPEGAYTLKADGAGRMEVLIIPDVGLSLRIEGIPKVLPEGDQFSGKVALRTRLGDEVKLAPEYLRDVVFTVSMGEQKLFDQPPNAAGEAKFSSKKSLKRGKYEISAKAVHQQGLLDVPPVKHSFVVMPQFAMDLAPLEIRFDTMAELGTIPLEGEVELSVASPDELPTDITVNLELPEGRARQDLRLTPTQITFGPDHPKKVPLELSFLQPEELRRDDVHYEGELLVTTDPEHARLLTGEHEWRFPVDGKLRSWTLGRYFEEYKWHLAIALAVLALIAFIIGRLIAKKFPPRARIHYCEIGQEFDSDVLIKRRSKHGAYRSARFSFPLGKKARKLATFRCTSRRFEVIPENKTLVTILDDDVPEHDREKRKPFAGRWEQRYQLSDRYEVWLTRV